MTAATRAVRPLLLAGAVAASSTVWGWCALLATIGWAGAVESGDPEVVAGTAAVCLAAALLGGGWVAGMLIVIPWSRDWHLREKGGLYAGAVASAVMVVIAVVAAL